VKINHQLGVVFDSIFYTVIFFNQENVHSFLKTYVEKESDIFENYYEFRKIYTIDPSDSLYPFFYYDARVPCVIRKYFDKYFDVINGTAPLFIKLLQEKEKFKRVVFYYYLEPLKQEINIEAVLRGDSEETALAVALLSAVHVDYPKQFYNLFYKFDELVDELILYMKIIMQKVTLFHNKNKSLFEEKINNFLSSEHLNIIGKNYFNNEKVDVSKQQFSISLFNRIIVQAYLRVNKQGALLIGDKCNHMPTLYANYNHVTDKSSASILSHEGMRDIIHILEKGEKTITQLSLILNYSRPTIDKFMGVLQDELAVKVSRKSGNEVFYKINHSYFIAAKTELIKAIDNILMRSG